MRGVAWPRVPGTQGDLLLRARAGHTGGDAEDGGGGLCVTVWSCAPPGAVWRRADITCTPGDTAGQLAGRAARAAGLREHGLRVVVARVPRRGALHAAARGRAAAGERVSLLCGFGSGHGAALSELRRGGTLAEQGVVPWPRGARGPAADDAREVQEIEAWCDAEAGPAKGDAVTVSAEFHTEPGTGKRVSDNRGRAQLRAGLTGAVKEVDAADGEAWVAFDGMQKWQWVRTRDLKHIGYPGEGSFHIEVAAPTPGGMDASMIGGLYRGMSVLRLKQLVSEAKGTPVAQQRLLCLLSGTVRPMADERKLGDYSLGSGVRVFLVRPLTFLP